jgi:hypothetical protein
MNYKVKTIAVFEKQVKRLVKKYPSLKNELVLLISELKLNPSIGVSLGHNCFKVRISIASKGKGKSGGARVITNFAITNHTVYLLSIYDKSEQENLTDKELKMLINLIRN